jgi:hypothetical protein
MPENLLLPNRALKLLLPRLQKIPPSKANNPFLHQASLDPTLTLGMDHPSFKEGVMVRKLNHHHSRMDQYGVKA